MQTLLTLLDKVQSSGAFSVSGTLPSIPPGLTVAGIGHIGLPLAAEQAQALIHFSCRKQADDILCESDERTTPARPWALPPSLCN
jgi:hypothetical protein